MLSIIDKKYFKLCNPEAKGSDVDLACRCHICGDSKYSKNKKRLHLYFKDGITRIKCFNCNYNGIMYTYLRDYFPEYLHNYKKETFINKLDFQDSENLQDSENFQDFEFNENLKNSKFENSQDLKNSKFENSSSFENSKFENPSSFENSNINKTSSNIKNFKYFKIPQTFQEISDEYISYLSNRCIRYRPEIFGKFYTTNESIIIEDRYFDLKNKIIIPFYYSNFENFQDLKNSKFENIYGFYSRSIKDKDFRTCNINENYKLWNWFNIDKNKPVYIFEGIFDALSFYEIYKDPNIIALCSADIPIDRLKELRFPKLCLDNDEKGIKTMLKYCKDFDVLIPNYKYKDFNDALKANYKIPLNFMKGFRAVLELKKYL